MTNDKDINSKTYWDMRFSSDWEIAHGPTQSREFSWLATKNLPSWFLRTLQQDELTLVDWGCAQGDGTDVWASYLPTNQIYGVDFSANGISQATERYPEIKFECSDWLDSKNTSTTLYDIVFSSNTLEHFSKPWEVLATLSTHAKKAVVLLLPFKEKHRITEHEYTFLPQNIPAKLDDDFSLIWAKAIDPHVISDISWPGDQIALIYAKNTWVKDLKLTLNDIIIDQNSCGKLKKDLRESHEKNISLEDIIAEKNKNHSNALMTIENQNETINSQNTTINNQNAIINDHLNLLKQSQQMVEALESSIKNNRIDFLEKLEELRIKESHSQVIAGEIEALQKTTHQIQNQNQNFDLQNNLVAREINIAHLHKELKNIRSSASWRITAPLRSTYSLLSKLGTPIFLKLPSGVQRNILHWVNPTVHPLPSSVVTLNQVNTSSATATIDLSWDEFSQKILSHRQDYKGIFVQEIVIDWHVPLYQRPQHMAVAMARLGYLVIYRTANWTADNVNGFREVEKDVWITNCDEVDSIDGVIRSLYSTAYSNSVDNILKNGARGQIIYEYIDHIDPEISGDDENIKRLTLLRNFAFAGGADYVVASAQKLYDEAAEAVGIEKTIMVQNGVDTRHYRDPKHKTHALPASLLDFKKKFKHIVGYFGALAPWLWYETIAELVREKSDVGFVFIGPDYYGGVEKLPQASNVIYLGAVDYKILPAYAMTFDVCFIPFKPGDIAKSTSPLKLFEYFALEKPVVVTSDMLECTRYPEVFHGNSVAELSSAIDKALAIKGDATFKKRLAQMADENNWDMRAAGLIAGLNK